MNRQLLLSALLFCLAAVAIPRFGLRADTCDSLVCGDADGNGAYNINDFIYITNFLFAGGPAPAPCGDIDGYDLFTIRDIVLGATMQPANCVTQPKIISQSTDQLELIYYGLLSSYQTTTTFSLYCKNNSTSDILAFDLPLAVRVEGEIPLSISVDLATSTWPGEDLAVSIDTAAGTILLSHLYGAAPPGEYTLCRLTIKAPYTFNYRKISLDYTELAPYMTGVIEPPNSACHYPVFLDDNLNALQPRLQEFCLCGDANGDGQFTVSDVAFIIAEIFSGAGFRKLSCLADANGSGGVSISDAVYLISYIFLGGPAPHCP